MCREVRLRSWMCEVFLIGGGSVGDVDDVVLGC